MEGTDWREASGLLIGAKKQVPEKALSHIWGDKEYFRLFVSHKAEVKAQVATLKTGLGKFGVSCFVAHVDIHPTKEWQDEIENALESMDGFVALLTPDYHDSSWTDQEVGFALARRVPIIAVRMGRDPYGFIGKVQALSCDWDACPLGVAKILVKHERMSSAFIRSLRDCKSFDTGNIIGKLLPEIEQLTPAQVDQIVSAYNENSELRGAFAWNGTKPAYYGLGLLEYLKGLDGRSFSVERGSGLIKVG